MWCLKVSFYASNVKMKGFQNVLSQAIVPCCGFERFGEKKIRYKKKRKNKSDHLFFVQCSSYFRLQASTL